MIGKILGRRYELVEKIGEGGMGLVYKAKCHLLNRYVAVKILKPELTGDEEFINKFKKESLSSASLSHPNIVNIYDVGSEDGIYYIVMEYVKGKTLKDIIKERAPLSYYEIINISRQICLALEHAHTNNIIHRDIKPHNILITHDGIVKVADFGIARASSSATLTNTGNVIGSVYYLSPEQARGGYTDEKTDIYSLGIVIYEMSVGRVPFMAESPVTIALKHIQDNAVKPSELNPDIPVALEDIILKCLEKNPAYRYDSAAAMIKDLDRASANSNVHIISKHDINDATKVMPAINRNDIKNIDDRDADDKEPVKKRGIRKVWIALLTVIITVILVGGLLFNYYNGFNKNADIPVPNIIGMDEAKAMQLLRDNGLIMQVIDRPNSDKPKGTIFYVSPGVGMSVKPNTVVKVRISAGIAKILVPNVTGASVTDGIFKLEEKGLKGNVIEIYDEKSEKNTIIKQFPGVNQEVDPGASVDLYVSKGPEIILAIVPSLEGLSFDKVEGKLALSNLKLGKVETKNDPTKPNNVVLEQKVAPNTEVKEGTAIDVVVNKIVEIKPPPTPPVDDNKPKPDITDSNKPADDNQGGNQSGGTNTAPNTGADTNTNKGNT